MRKPLNDRQAALLQRISDDTAPVTSHESGLATSVYALQHRRLVKLTRSKGSWTAEITDEGRFYLEHGRCQPGAVDTPTWRPSASGRRGQLDISAPELLKRVKEAGCRLTITNPDTATRAAWRRAIYRALNDGLVPAGKQLRHSGRDHGDLVLSLVDLEADGKYRAVALSPVPIPMQLARPHRLVTATRKAAQDSRRRDKGWLDTSGIAGVFSVRLSRPQLGRALLLLQALVDEALRRGHEIGPAGSVGAVGLVVRGHESPFSLIEEVDRVRRELTAREQARKDREYWYRPQEFDELASGRLQLRLGRPEYGRTSSWADRKRWKLDDRLPHVLAAMEQAANEAEARERERQRRQEAAQRAWEAAAEHARRQLREDHRRDVLRQQVTDWRLAADIRAYCAALRSASSADNANDRAEWTTWAEGYADVLDPLRRTNLLAADPEPTPAALQPYLPRGFSAHGPERIWLRDP